MVDDPYTTLGVPKGASEDDIRRAFRKLAKELHPDINPGDAARAERFKKVSVAYEMLSDPEKRAKFDRGEIDAAGDPRYPFHRQQGGRAQGGAAGGAPFDTFGDVFADLFGARGGPGRVRPGGGFPMRGQDMRYTLEVDFLEAVGGARKRVTLPEGGVLDLTVPEGVTDGQVLRLRGKGAPGIGGGEAGDALVEIKVRPHSSFRRVGDDIHIEIPIALDEAVLGAKIEVATISGKVSLTVPKGTSSGRVFRLKAKGARNLTTGGIGDQLVTVRIVLPDQIDDSLAYFLSEWRQKNGYNPRG